MIASSNAWGLPDLERAVAAGEIDTVIVAFTDIYGRLMGKRLDAGFFVDEGAQHGTHACDYLLTVDMEMEPVRGYRLANWDKGYGDFHLAPDLHTLRRLSWSDKTALVLCDVRHADGRAVQEAPRALLEKQRQRLQRLGFEARAASEIEYYLFKDSYETAAAKNYRDLLTAGRYIEDYHIFQGAQEEHFHGAVRRHLRDSGVPVESSKGEWGPGQHELNVRYAEVLEMADRHCVYKECLKEVAHAMDLSVSFMAKYAEDLAGSSCHIHLSLWKDGRSAFAGPAAAAVSSSNEFRWFLGGWLAHLRETLVFYAPTVNSYKRYQTESWAPTGIAWSCDNRTVGFRVVGAGENLRIECRVPGADCNPYLAYAAALAAGIDGIEKRIEPPPMFEGDAYGAASLPQVPATLGDAAELFAASEFASESLGAGVVEHYAHFFRSEERKYRKAVTDWERRRYFERI